jgi:hypothetical protein
MTTTLYCPLFGTEPGHGFFDHDALPFLAESELISRGNVIDKIKCKKCGAPVHEFTPQKIKRYGPLVIDGMSIYSCKTEEVS